MASILSSLSLFKPLFSYDLWSRLGFLFSYILTSLLVLEVLRLVYTDANKREVEKLLDAYSASSSSSSSSKARSLPRSASPPLKRMRIPIEQLERPRTPSPAAATVRERPAVEGEVRRSRKVSSSSAAAAAAQIYREQQIREHLPKEVTPTRRLRKRSDTLTSTGSSSSSSRRRREESPADSKTSSRHASPAPVLRTRSKDATKSASRLEKMMRAKP